MQEQQQPLTQQQEDAYWLLHSQLKTQYLTRVRAVVPQLKHLKTNALEFKKVDECRKFFNSLGTILETRRNGDQIPALKLTAQALRRLRKYQKLLPEMLECYEGLAKGLHRHYPGSAHASPAGAGSAVQSAAAAAVAGRSPPAEHQQRQQQQDDLQGGRQGGVQESSLLHQQQGAQSQPQGQPAQVEDAVCLGASPSSSLHGSPPPRLPTGAAGSASSPIAVSPTGPAADAAMPASNDRIVPLPAAAVAAAVSDAAQLDPIHSSPAAAASEQQHHQASGQEPVCDGQQQQPAVQPATETAVASMVQEAEAVSMEVELHDASFSNDNSIDPRHSEASVKLVDTLDAATLLYTSQDQLRHLLQVQACLAAADMGEEQTQLCTGVMVAIAPEPCTSHQHSATPTGISYPRLRCVVHACWGDHMAASGDVAHGLSPQLNGVPLESWGKAVDDTVLLVLDDGSAVQLGSVSKHASVCDIPSLGAMVGEISWQIMQGQRAHFVESEVVGVVSRCARAQASFALAEQAAASAAALDGFASVPDSNSSKLLAGFIHEACLQAVCDKHKGCALPDTSELQGLLRPLDPVMHACMASAWSLHLKSSPCIDEQPRQLVGCKDGLHAAPEASPCIPSTPTTPVEPRSGSACRQVAGLSAAAAVAGQRAAAAVDQEEEAERAAADEEAAAAVAAADQSAAAAADQEAAAEARPRTAIQYVHNQSPGLGFRRGGYLFVETGDSEPFSPRHSSRDWHAFPSPAARQWSPKLSPASREGHRGRAPYVHSPMERATPPGLSPPAMRQGIGIGLHPRFPSPRDTGPIPRHRAHSPVERATPPGWSPPAEGQGIGIDMHPRFPSPRDTGPIPRHRAHSPVERATPPGWSPPAEGQGIGIGMRHCFPSPRDSEGVPRGFRATAWQGGCGEVYPSFSSPGSREAQPRLSPAAVQPSLSPAAVQPRLSPAAVQPRLSPAAVQPSLSPGAGRRTYSSIATAPPCAGMPAPQPDHILELAEEFDAKVGAQLRRIWHETGRQWELSPFQLLKEYDLAVPKVLQEAFRVTANQYFHIRAGTHFTLTRNGRRLLPVGMAPDAGTTDLRARSRSRSRSRGRTREH